ncbi:MAG TPA: hypothetical protein VFV72_16710 [Candidatus Limnocylindrales bacterium]|nr:hypothetical protein [Candidatus Limnocylindrales bacterium]
MKSIAAYYAFIAVNSLDQEAAARRAHATAPKVARPSLGSRVRALFASRSSQPATTAA